VWQGASHLAAESTLVLAVLGDLVLLDHLTEGGTVPGTVFTNNSCLLSAFTLQDTIGSQRRATAQNDCCFEPPMAQALCCRVMCHRRPEPSHGVALEPPRGPERGSNPIRGANDEPLGATVHRIAALGQRGSSKRTIFLLKREKGGGDRI
jgi:hypothetical protein